VLGNIFFAALAVKSFLPGRSRADSVKVLLLKIKAYYRRANPPTKINSLTVDMIKRDGKKPKLRLKGAETRHLVPFCVELAEECYKVTKTPYWFQILQLSRNLLTFYMCLGVSPYDAETAAVAARHCLEIYAALSAITPDLMRVLKPKAHLFAELAEFQAREFGDPRWFWAYQDEDFVGMIGKIAASRGGARVVDTIARIVFDKYRVLTK